MFKMGVTILDKAVHILKRCPCDLYTCRDNIADAGSVVAGGTGGCRPDNRRCHQWRRGLRRGGSRFSVALPLIITLMIVQCSYMCIIFN